MSSVGRHDFNIKYVIAQRYYVSKVGTAYIRPALCRLCSRGRYDGGLIGGHTIEYSAFFDYLIVYNCARYLVKGPLIASPISASDIGLKRREKYLGLLRSSLNKIDLIFVRGNYSFKMLSRFVNEEDRLRVALDSGFGVKLLYENPSKAVKKKSHELIICVVPRRDYLDFYKLSDLYEKYLETFI